MAIYKEMGSRKTLSSFILRKKGKIAPRVSGPCKPGVMRQYLSDSLISKVKDGGPELQSHCSTSQGILLLGWTPLG